MLWSTRTNSSRQVVGVDTVCANAGRPPSVVLAFGIRASRACPVGEIGTAAGLATLGQSAADCAQASVKLPPRSASEGTLIGEIVAGFFSRRHSWDQKTNVFFLSVL